ERTAAYTATTIDITAAGIAIRSERSRYVARNRLGSVVMSPSAVTIGVDTESRSHPRRGDRTDSVSVIIRISPDPSAPPTIETVARRHSEIDGSPNAAEASTDR